MNLPIIIRRGLAAAVLLLAAASLVRDADRQRGELEANGGDAADRVAGFVLGEASTATNLVPKILEAALLDFVEQGLVVR